MQTDWPLMLQVAALRSEKLRWEGLTAERDAAQGKAAQLDAELARLRVRPPLWCTNVCTYAGFLLR